MFPITYARPQPRASFPAANRSAFALSEMLVVIAIIVNSAAILFPVFAQARASARETSSRST